MDRIKYIVMGLLVLIINISTHAQENMDSYPHISNKIPKYYTMSSYPEEFAFIFSTFLHYLPSEDPMRPIEDGFYMFFMPDSATVIRQYVSKMDEPELYAKYDPVKDDNNGTSTIVDTKKKNRKALRLLYQIHQELEKQLIVSVNLKEVGDGVYICKSFNINK